MIKAYLADCECLKDEALLDRAIKVLPSWRVEKLSKIKSEKAKRQSAAAGILWVYAMKECGIDVNGAEIELRENGKPFLKGNSNLFFSISHSKDYCLLAVSDKPIGCDIQKREKIEERIAKRFFSRDEYDYLEGLSTVEKTVQFYRLWAAKESIAKTSGKGIAMLPNINFKIDGGKISYEGYEIIEKNDLLKGYSIAFAIGN